MVFSALGVFNNLAADSPETSPFLGPYRPLLTAIQLSVVVLAVDRIIKLVLINHPIIPISCKLISVTAIFMFGVYLLSSGYYFSHENGRFMALTNEPGIMSVSIGAVGCILAKLRANTQATLLSVILIAGSSTMGLFMACVVCFFVYKNSMGKFARFTLASVVIVLLLVTGYLLSNFQIPEPDIFAEHVSKFLLLSTAMDPVAGGRYATNLLNIQAIMASPIIGFGLDSYIGKAFALTGHVVVAYDRGGSDMLIVLSDFGIIGTILLGLSILPLTRNKRIKLIYKILILIPLVIKGVGIYSIIGILPYAYFLSASVVNTRPRRSPDGSPYRCSADT